MSSFKKAMMATTVGCIAIPAVLAVVVSKTGFSLSACRAKVYYRRRRRQKRMKLFKIVLVALIGSLISIAVGYYGALLLLAAF